MKHGETARLGVRAALLGSTLLGAGCGGDAGHADQASPVAALAPFRAVLGLRAGSLAGRRGPPAEVALPRRLPAGVAVRAPGLAVRVGLVGARDTPGEAREGGLWFDGALGPGTGALVRADAAGFEDHLLIDHPLADSEVRYAIAPGEGAAGLRLIGGVLEILDRGGAPRLRMEAPFVVDATGTRRAARVRVEGCAVDRSPRAPWGRRVTAPGAATCEVVVSWGGEVSYPILVDPGWTLTGAMAFARARHELHGLPSGRAIAIGGVDDAGALASSEVFDPVSGTWAMTGAMAKARYNYGSATLASGEVLVAGGLNETDGSLALAERYDPTTGTFLALPSLGAPRANLTATVLVDGRVLLVGGCVYDAGSGGCPVAAGPAEIYDPAAQSFTPVGSLQQARFLHRSALLQDGRVLVAGGFDGSEDLAVTELFDPKTQQFAIGPPLIDPRSEATLTALSDGVLLLAGGVTGNNFLGTSEYFDPQAVAWFSAPTFPDGQERAAHRALLLPDGQLTILGGFTNLGDVASGLQVGSEHDASWVAGSEAILAQARSLHASLVLGTGQALVAGGTLEGSALKTVELFGKAASGLTCTQNTECTSQHCVDGVCCDKACDSPCLACSAKVKGQGADGLCGPVVAGQDPHKGCPDFGVALCAETGTCDGQGECATYPVGSACAAPSCLAGVEVTSSCVSQGTCLPAQHPCAPFACAPDGLGCAATCASDDGCDEKAFCSQGACVKREPEGHPCAAGHDCLSGFCADGVCCDSACLGQCESCGVAPNVGACSPQPPGAAPAANKPACAGDGVCGGRCDGVSRAACSYAGSLVTCAARCEAGRETQDRCDGLGHCSPQPPRDCAPYTCAADACRAGCAADAECTTGYTCTDGACIPRSAARCLGDHTLQGPDGAVRDCSPYRCSAEGACLQACDSTIDCATGQTCRSDRVCRPDLAPPDPADPGCGCRLAGGLPPLPAGPLGLAALAGLARLVRRRSRPGR
jgi:hypothetical protein